MMDNHHLHDLVEFIFVNVGGCVEGVNGCSPPIPRHSVGGVIVLGARESHVQGEGRQGVDVLRG